MNYQTITEDKCYGGLQPKPAGMPFSIFGDVFLKGVFVVFESKPGAQARLGFAQQSSGAGNPQDAVSQDVSEPNPFGPLPPTDSPKPAGTPIPATPAEEENPWGPLFGDDERTVV